MPVKPRLPVRILKLPVGKPIHEVEDLIKGIRDVRSRTTGLGQVWYFRGDKESAPLKPKIGQKATYAGKTLSRWSATQENNLLDRFRRFAYPHFEQPMSEWEALFLARHYELPTRILDWSANPLVALYFACRPTSRDRDNGVLSGILRSPVETSDLKILSLKRGPFDPWGSRGPAVKLVYPVYNSERIIAQKGIFTWHSEPRIALTTYCDKRTPFRSGRLDIVAICRWPIPQTARTPLVEQLDRLGINQRTIFPDIGGITNGLWQTEVLWHGR